MDKKKTLISVVLMAVSLMSSWTSYSQNVSKVEFCDRKYEYSIGRDSISLFFNILDENGGKVVNLPEDSLLESLVMYEGSDSIKAVRSRISVLKTGQRIPDDYTFSVMVDLSMPESGKSMICSAIRELVEAAADSSVYLSFFGSEVTSSIRVDKANYGAVREKFERNSETKDLFSALYSKLEEFSPQDAKCDNLVRKEDGYSRNVLIADRAAVNPDRNILLIFTKGDRRSDDYVDITSMDVVDYIQELSVAGHMPKVYVFYYMSAGRTLANERFYGFLCNPVADGRHVFDKPGKYMPSGDIEGIMDSFKEVVNDQSYDYAYTYQAEKIYNGGRIHYSAFWDGENIGSADYSIGLAERPWPERGEKTGGVWEKYLLATLITILGILLFYVCTKILLPLIRFRLFSLRYYKKYKPEVNVKRRVCPYCREPLEEGELVVTKCQHTMHQKCWKENGYKCVEYGQNCTSGRQTCVEWNALFTKASYADCYQTITGILAGLVSWVLYELSGRGYFEKISSAIVGVCYDVPENGVGLIQECTALVSSLLTIGVCLGFFLSLIFRANDEYRSRNWKIWLKIIALSLLTGLIGMTSFAAGGGIFCMFVKDAAYIPWYAAFPGYILFSICVSLGLTIKSTIPVKSALIGGFVASVIGFMVLYFVDISHTRHVWMTMLLDFILFSGGLGASLVTVRMLAEKYYLVIQNGVRAGQRIPIHKWMNATGGGNKVTIGMTGDCEIQMNWEKSNKVAKEHAQLYLEYEKKLPMIKPLSGGIIYNMRGELTVNRPVVLSNGDTIQIGDTLFKYVEAN